MTKPEKLICVLAEDWTFYEEPHEIEIDHFELVRGWVSGILIHEDEKRLIIASHLFPSQDKVRHVTVIPQVNVVERVDRLLSEPEKPRKGKRHEKKTGH